MGKIKNALALTNPVTYLFGVPIFIGFVLAAMFDGVAKKTKKIVESFEEDF